MTFNFLKIFCTDMEKLAFANTVISSPVLKFLQRDAL